MKNCKIFYEAQTVSHLKEIIHLYSFLSEIHRNIQKFALKVLQDAFLRRQEIVQCKC